MDPLEEQIRELFKNISFSNSNVLDADIVDSLEIIKKKAKVVLIIPEEHSSLRRVTCDEIEKALLNIKHEIESVNILVKNDASVEETPHSHQPKAPKKTTLLSNYKHVIAVASGKGGVGKSTVAVNLAISLKKLGNKVSLFDADLYGPSIPMMMGKRGIKPEIIGSQVLPLSSFGIEFLSIGSIVSETDSLVWRGPMVHQAVEQMLRDTTWPGGDYCIIDMPPGTGDIQISLSQMTELTGAIIVCTPQDLALLDAKKAIGMFSKVDIPILGMVENMSTFTCDGCGKVHEIFSKGHVEKHCEEIEVPFLGKLPITLDIRMGGDSGKPVSNENPSSDAAIAFSKIAKNIDQLIKEAENEA